MPMKIDEALKTLEGYIDPVDENILKALDAVKAEIERKDAALTDCHHFLSDLKIESDEDSCGMAFITNRVCEDSYYITLNNAKQALTKPEEDGDD